MSLHVLAIAYLCTHLFRLYPQNIMKTVESVNSMDDVDNWSWCN